MKRIHPIVFLSVTLPGAWVPASATDIPIAACGFAINAPGNYGVAADLNCPVAGASAITINASNVSLKLNGHILTGPGSTNTLTAAINVNPGLTPRLNHVAVAGPGLIQGFNPGILIENADYTQVSEVTAAHNVDGVTAAWVNYLTIGSNALVANKGIGLDIGEATSSVIQNNDLSGNGYMGLAMTGGSGNTVNNNVASGNGSDGIMIGDNYSRVYSNVTNGNRANGMLGSGIDIYFVNFSTGQAPVGNVIFNNTSSVGNAIDDLEDQTACGMNSWSDNTFFTRDLACIR